MSKKVIIAAEGCGACQTLKQKLTDQGKINDYEIVDLQTSDGQQRFRELIKECPELLKDDYVPNCAEIDENGTVHKCDINKVWDEAEGK